MIALVHNGVIENYVALKQFLTEKGHTFSSQTDTEVLAVLIADLYTELKAKNHVPHGVSLLQRAVQAALQQVEGTYGIAVICKDEPDTLVVARKGSPLIIGVGKDEYIVASDASAIVEHTASVIYLNDNEMAVLHPGTGFRTSTIDDVEISPVISQLENKIEAYELGDYEHYMLKEIFEQPHRHQQLPARPRRAQGRPDRPRRLDRTHPRIASGAANHPHRPGNRLACGTARRLSAGRPGQGRHRMHLRLANSAIAIRSSRKERCWSPSASPAKPPIRWRPCAKARKRAPCAWAIVNVVGSTIARETDGGIYLHAGPEIGVASTKAFTCQCVVLTMLSLYLGRRRFMGQAQCQEIIDGLCAIPEQMEKVLHAERADQGDRR